MARAFVQDGAFALPGAFFEDLIPVAPAVIELGSPGAAEHRLPFRTLGGSIVDLDLLYGVLGNEAALDDIQPIFALATRSGMIRAFGFEIPRQAIQDAVIESYATLLDVEDIVLDSNPAGTNLFGYVGLTTRPLSTVRISNTDGYWTTLVLRELILGAPAGLFVDIAHRVVAPVLTGTVAGYSFEDGAVVIRYGFQARRKDAPSVTD